MSESKPSGVRGWIKGVIGGAAGLVSGAALMALTPWVTNAVKPGKPVANFEIKLSGLSVTFNNRSVGGSQARWDFGDGTPLEFVSADQPSITHTYSKPGNFQARLTLVNAVGEESERTVNIEITGQSAEPATPPQVVDLFVRPPGKVGGRVFAPATFQFEATADDAQLFLWDFGDGRGIHLADHNVSHTFDRPGSYNVTVYAFNGKMKSQMDVGVEVSAPSQDMLSFKMAVTDHGTEVITKNRETTVSKAVQLTGKNDPTTLTQTLSATPGFEIAGVQKKKSTSKLVENVAWQIAPDKRSVQITGKIGKAKAGDSAVLNEQLVLVEQRKEKAQREPVPMAGAVAAGAPTTLALPAVPANWTDVQRQYSFELWHASQLLWKGSQLPHNVPVTIAGQTYTLAAMPKGEQVQVTLVSRVAAN